MAYNLICYDRKNEFNKVSSLHTMYDLQELTHSVWASCKLANSEVHVRKHTHIHILEQQCIN